MEKTPAGWTVIDREAGVLSYIYHFSKSGSSACFVAPMTDGSLVVVSPPTRPSDALVAELAEFGPIGALVANNGFHHLGQKAWRDLYPDVVSYAPAAAMGRIAKRSEFNIEYQPLTALAERLGDGVGFRDVPKTKSGESWFWARTASGYAWFMSDVLINLPALPPKFPMKQLFKWTGSAPGYRVFGMAMKFMHKDVKGTLRLLLEDLEAHPPSVVIPAHGDWVHGDDTAERTRQAVLARL